MVGVEWPEVALLMWIEMTECLEERMLKEDVSGGKLCRVDRVEVRSELALQSPLPPPPSLDFHLFI
jgi:hypothetical protein